MPASDVAARASTHGPVKSAAYAAGAAFATLVSFAPLNFWPLAVLGPAGIVWVAMHASSWRRAVLVIGATQMVVWAMINAWMFDVAGATFLLLPPYLAVYPVAVGLVLRRLLRDGRWSTWPVALLLPPVWMAAELLRGLVLLYGYPWYLLAQPYVEAPILVQSADLSGAFGVSAGVAFIAGALVDGALARSRRRPWRSAAWSLGAAALLFAANLGYGAWRLGQATTAPLGVFLAVQTNLELSNKIAWTPEAQREDLTAFIDLTRRAAAAAGDVDAIIWPETMVPGIGFEVDMRANAAELGPGVAHIVEHPARVEALQAELGVPMLVGSGAWVGTDLERQRDEQGDLIVLTRTASYNSVYLLDGPPPHERVDKTFLTPMGETIPYISAWPWLEERVLAIGVGVSGMKFELDRGASIRRLTVPVDGTVVRVATPICFEDTVPGLVRRMVYGGGTKPTDLLINASNDGWFGRSRGGRQHHAQIARFRCIENRVPMLRVRNTGCSVAIDSSGRLIGAVGDGRYGESGRSGWLRAALDGDSRRTLFGRLGHAPVIVIALLAPILLLTTGRRTTPPPAA